MLGGHPQPVLLLHPPAGHDVDPQAAAALQRVLARRYGAALQFGAGAAGVRDVPPLLLGRWPQPPREVRAALTPMIARVFFSLDWLERAI